MFSIDNQIQLQRQMSDDEEAYSAISLVALKKQPRKHAQVLAKARYKFIEPGFDLADVPDLHNFHQHGCLRECKGLYEEIDDADALFAWHGCSRLYHVDCQLFGPRQRAKIKKGKTPICIDCARHFSRIMQLGVDRGIK